jgi:hypothetical protein
MGEEGHGEAAEEGQGRATTEWSRSRSGNLVLAPFVHGLAKHAGDGGQWIRIMAGMGQGEERSAQSGVACTTGGLSWRGLSERGSRGSAAAAANRAATSATRRGTDNWGTGEGGVAQKVMLGQAT